ncbi:DUF4440 domain-containing protein [Pseudoxanthomonas indica]|uniref:Ketosteroid isomerase homolog n=1 Tax=Pseudoxanthomonas indica TaxID=428993 RepID=A0A1T5JXZ5_9GAMM|nr:DUF4440 domain-containing protein [Pseudoxanthomonas indica]GGD45261.1 hypothetical protein GCM10007235_16470 [Pseudoxanthomonas indica]SKC56297.1 Ketosteroid isomerase homolog [Pseudoxanthomonas indica]
MHARVRTRILWVAALWLSCACAHATQTVEAEIAARNAEWARAASATDLAALGSRYADDATLMPEHAKLRRGRDDIHGYLQQWWQQARVTRWERQTDSLDKAGDHLIEIGRYTQRLQREGQPAYDYVGKYLAVWRNSAEGPRVIAELWGASAPFDRALLPELTAPTDTSPAIDTASAPVKRELADRNALITRLVKERKGAEHATLFAADAAYLTYYTPTLRGMDAIRDYFVEHERPGPVTIEAIEIHSDGVHALDAGTTQLEEGRYRVAWRAGGDSGVVEGKSLNLWKRGEDGQWRLFRQAVNHD